MMVEEDKCPIHIYIGSNRLGPGSGEAMKKHHVVDERGWTIEAHNREETRVNYMDA